MSLVHTKKYRDSEILQLQRSGLTVATGISSTVIETFGVCIIASCG